MRYEAWVPSLLYVAALFPHNDVIKWKKHFPRYWLWCGEFTGHRWIPRTKASDAELWCFFDMRLNQQLSKQWRRCWFKMPSRSLWRHCNACNIVTDKNKNHALSRRDIFIVAAIFNTKFSIAFYDYSHLHINWNFIQMCSVMLSLVLYVWFSVY